MNDFFFPHLFKISLHFLLLSFYYVKILAWLKSISPMKNSSAADVIFKNKHSVCNYEYHSIISHPLNNHFDMLIDVHYSKWWNGNRGSIIDWTMWLAAEMLMWMLSTSTGKWFVDLNNSCRIVSYIKQRPIGHQTIGVYSRSPTSNSRRHWKGIRKHGHGTEGK